MAIDWKKRSARYSTIAILRGTHVWFFTSMAVLSVILLVGVCFSFFDPAVVKNPVMLSLAILDFALAVCTALTFITMEVLCSRWGIQRP